ncbi:MAG TPA: hypothetical protein DCX53_00995 [Anaerolineae bacterium]|nr:hypothetical protein [Anaerolineae bacterium]
MNHSKSVMRYDLFKLIVTIVLLLTFLGLLLLGSKGDTVPSSDAPAPSTPTSASAAQATPSPTVVSSPTSVPTEARQPLPTDAPANAPSPTATLTATPQAIDPSVDETTAETSSCEEIANSQIEVGMIVMIKHRLNFRSSPGIHNNRVLTNLPGTQVEVIGGPICTRYRNSGAYLWWQIELPNGLVGWSAEASIFGDYFFMEPVN